MSITTIPEPIYNIEQRQAAMLDRGVILFTTDAERIQAWRKYWRIMIEVAVFGVPFTDDFGTLTGALALEKTQLTNDLQNAQSYVKNRALAATIKARADAIKTEQKRHGHVLEQRVLPDAHNAEFVVHSDAMIRLRDAHEEAQLAYQACSQFENGLSHLMNVRDVVDELASNNPEAIQN